MSPTEYTWLCIAVDSALLFLPVPLSRLSAVSVSLAAYTVAVCADALSSCTLRHTMLIASALAEPEEETVLKKKVGSAQGLGHRSVSCV